MVIAVATASPLFTDAIPASATERDYLTALRKTLLYKPDPNQPDRLVDASALALTTREPMRRPRHEGIDRRAGTFCHSCCCSRSCSPPRGPASPARVA